MATNQLAYDHPNYTVVRHFAQSGTVGASLTDFCKFRVRTAALVKFAHVAIVSAPSVASGRVCITRSGTTLAVSTVASASLVAGASFLFTLPATATVSTVSDYIGLRLSGTEKGDWDVTYEYVLLPEGDVII